MHRALPRELAEFLDFHIYELTHLLQSMARRFFHEADKLLADGEPVILTPLQVKFCIKAITEVMIYNLNKV